MTPALSFRNVSCRFDGADVVDGVSFDIQAGEIICLLGPSGCGKTTSLRLAAGMEVPSGGEIYLAGECVSTPQDVAPPEARGIGFLFQDFALFPHLSVYENVTFGLGHLPKEEQKARALELLNAVGLSGFASKYPNILSGGEQQRAALARAMAAKPKLVLMDEPFSNLDPQLRDQMRDLTLRLLRENGAAGLIVTHDAADALRMADRIAVQNKGQILQMDTPEAIYQNPVDLHVAAMFGPLNIWPMRKPADKLACAQAIWRCTAKRKIFLSTAMCKMCAPLAPIGCAIWRFRRVCCGRLWCGAASARKMG